MMESRTTGLSDSNEISGSSCISCVGGGGGGGNITERESGSPTRWLSHEASAPEIAALRRLSENLESVFDSPDSFPDAKIVVASGREVPVHRCVLLSRSPFFRDVFSRKDGPAASEIQLKNYAKDFEIGFDSLSAVLAYLYSGKVRPLPKSVCDCADEDCEHVACGPAVYSSVEVLYASFVFQVSELVTLYQRHLLDILDKVAVYDILVVLSIANMCGKACVRLLAKCTEIIVKSDIDFVTLEKRLPENIVKQITDARMEAFIDDPESYIMPNKHVRRIHRALDSDDVELVRMLLKEAHTTLDDACALHYAVAYCDAKTTMEVLDLELADVNHKDSRGYTVLHVAAMRKDPKIIVSLLTKGAQPSALTADGRKAVQISKRVTRAVDYDKSTEEGQPTPKDRLCIEILEQAERRDPLLGEASVSLAMAGDDLRGKLLYLENRVALAKLLFPMEAKLAMDIAQVDGTSEFLNYAQRATVDLNEAPFKFKEEHLNRLSALSKTVELGKCYFPRCSKVLNDIMDADDLSHLASMNNDTPEEKQVKKRRYMELEECLSKAFNEDKEENDRSSSLFSTSVSTRSNGKASQKKR